MTSTTTEQMEKGSNAPHIRRTYKTASRFQWAREAVVNALQALASLVRFTTEWVAVTALGVHRRVLIDNGIGMTAAQMPGFMNKFGGSGKIVGDTSDNYGIGLKTSTYPWNEYGLVAIAKQDGRVSMMWLHYDAAIGDYGGRNITAEMLDLDDSDDVDWLNSWKTFLGATSSKALSVLPLDGPDEFAFDEAIIDGIDWVKVAAPLAEYESGTMLVFCGNVAPTMNAEGVWSGGEHTILGDPGRDEAGKYGLVEYMNGKLWGIPDKVVVQVRQYDNWTDPTSWPKSAKDGWSRREGSGGSRQFRNAQTLEDYLNAEFNRANKAGTGIRGQAIEEILIPVSADNPIAAKVKVWLFNEQPDRRDRACVPLMTVIHSAHDEVTETFDMTHAAADLNRWCRVKPVRDLMAIVVEPIPSETQGVFPDAARASLRYSSDSEGGAPLPLNAWADAFFHNPPACVAEAIKAYYMTLSSNGEDGLTEEDYTRLGQRFGEIIFRVKRWVSAKSPTGAKGTLDGVQAKRKHNGKRRPVTPKPPTIPTDTCKPDVAGAVDIVERSVGVSMIHVNAGREAAMEHPSVALSFDDGEKMGTLNMDHAFVVQAREALFDKHASSITDALQPRVDAEIQKAFLSHAALALTAQYRLAMAHPDRREILLGDNGATTDALTAALGGVRHLMDAATGPLGTVFKATGTADPRSKRKAAKKAA